MNKQAKKQTSKKKVKAPVSVSSPFKAGDYTCLISLGPGDDPVAQEQARTGGMFNAVAIEVHFSCATGITTS